MDPLIFSGDAFSEYYFTQVIWEDTAVKADLDVSGANGALRRAATLISRAQRTLVERQRPASTQSALLLPLAELLGWQLGEPERVETEEGSEEAGAALLDSEGKPLARVRWLAPDAPMDLPSERVHRRFAPTLSMVRVLEEENLTWGLLLNAYELRLIRRAEGFVHSSLSVDLATMVEDPEDGPRSWRLIWGLLRAGAWTTTPAVLDRAVMQAKDHAAKVGKGLGQQVQQAVVDLVQGILDHPDNAARRSELIDSAALARLYRQALRTLYRCLFVLYGEARGLLPLDIPTYRESYSLSRLSRLATAEGADAPEFATGSYLEESLRALFELLRTGADLGPDGRIPSYGGGLFDNSPDSAESTHLIESLRWGDAAVAQVLEHLTLVPTKQGLARVSYRELNVEELGSIYESLLELHLEVADDELWRVRLDGRECVVTTTQRAELADRRGEVVERELAAAIESETEEDDVEDEAYADGDADGDEEASEDPDEAPAPKAAKKPVRILERIPAGKAFLRPGMGRKSSGSYYTNRAFVEFLVRRTADPLAEGKTPDQILALKCVDPAMGSGHFLVGLTRRLAEHLLNAYRKQLDAATEAFPDADRDELFLVADVPDDVARVWDNAERAEAACRLLVAGHCIYGVDKNELAVDLARVALWLATAATDHPLSFLDHRLQCGDSLLGYDVDQLLEPLSRDTKKDRRLEATGSDTDIFGASRRQLNEHLRRALGHLKTLADLAPGDFRGQRVAYQAVRGELRPFWEMHELRVGLHFVDSPDFSLLDGWLRDITEQGSPSAGTREACNAPLGAGKRQQAFCWPLAFPDVWFEVSDAKGAAPRVKAGPGFDVVVGNPPWDKIKPERKQFYGEVDPTVWALQAREIGAFSRKLHDSMPGLAEKWDAFEATTKAYARFLRSSGVFRHQIAEVNGKKTGGDADLFKLFLERAHGLSRSGGRVGFLLPGALCTTEGSTGLRRMLLDRSVLESLFVFHNARKRFFQIHADTKFATLVFSPDSEGTASFLAAFNLRDEAFLRTPSPLEVTRDYIEMVSPGHLTITELRSPSERDLVGRLYSSFHRLGTALDAPWKVSFTRERDMSGDSYLFRDRDWLVDHGCEHHHGEWWTSPETGVFDAQPERFVRGTRYVWREGSRRHIAVSPPPPSRTRPTSYETYDGYVLRQQADDPDEMPVVPHTHYIPLYVGYMVGQYDGAAKAYLGGAGAQARWRSLEWQEKEAVPMYFVATQDAAPGLAGGFTPRPAYCGVNNKANERTFVATIIPGQAVCGHRVPTVEVGEGGLLRGLAFVVWANSLVTDYLLRMTIDTTLDYFHVRALPAPFEAAMADRALRSALRLVMGVPAVAAEVQHSIPPEFLQNISGSTDALGRSQLRAYLDAVMADAYGLCEVEFALVLSTFPSLDRDQAPLPGDCAVRETKTGERREPRSYITRDKALLALFDLRGKEPPTDVVEFFASAGIDISRNTGPVRDLRERVAEAERRGAIAYIPSVRGRPPEESLSDWSL
jgi:hypothetical protein